MPPTDVVLAAARAPTRPTLTPSVASALRFATRSLYPADGPSRLVFDPLWVPPLVAPAVLREVRQAIAAHEAYLAPVDPERLALRVAGLTEHWYVAEGDRAVQDVATLDWLDALLRFPEWAVAEACADWIGHQTRRPVPADIANRCRELTGKFSAQIIALRRLLQRQEGNQ